MTKVGGDSGLSGVIAGESSICTVGKKGAGLNYRGYSIENLAEEATFEEVAYLLLYGELPNANHLSEYKQKLSSLRRLSPGMKVMLELIPFTAHPMDVLRTATSMLGTFFPESNQQNSNKQYIVDLLMASMGPMLLYWYHFHANNVRIETYTGPEDSIASNFIKLLHYPQKSDYCGINPDPLLVKVVDVSLILYAEHEFAASTFACRITISTMSDLYSGICTAIGTLRGPLHGGANEAAYRLISSFSSPDDAEKGILELLSKKKLIMGFGHRVYKKGDPRSPIIRKYAKLLSEHPKFGNKKLYETAERIEQVMLREKNMFTNLDFYASIAYHLCGIPTDFFTPVFVCARASGWIAHAVEQRQNNRLIRPSSTYVGPQAKSFTPISQRPNLSSL